MPLRALAALAGCLVVAAPAAAVLIDSDDGTGNTNPPAFPYEDPGFDHMGTLNFKNAVYVGNGWVLTANHVGVLPVDFGGVIYNPVSPLGIILQNPNQTNADLVLFGVDPAPPLPILPIWSTSPPVGTSVIMIGEAFNRGPATDSDDPLTWTPPPPVPPVFGWEWGGGAGAMRWGTNHITAYVPGGIGFTEAFYTTFDEAQPDHEAQSTVGDSGGGVFAKDGPDWKLAGIMIALGNFPPQTLMTALYGNVTYSADLSAYSDQIVDTIAVPEPAWLLQIGAGLGFLATVGRRRMRP